MHWAGALMETGEFKGRIGRYHWESEPYWPDEPRPRQGAPNILVVVLDDVGYAQLGCFGSDIDTPNFDRPRRQRPALRQLPHHRALLPDAGVPAHRAQPPRVRHGPRRRSRHPASPGTTRASRGRAPSSRRCSPRTGTRPRPSASGISRRRTKSTSGPPRPVAARARLRTFLRLLRRRDAPVRAVARPRQPLRRSAAVRSRTATTSAKTSPTAPSSSSSDLRHVDVDKPLLPLLRDGRLPLAASSAARVARPLPGPFRSWLGRVARGGARPAEGQRAAPGARRALARPEWVPAWDDAERRRAARVRPVHGGVRRIPVARGRASRPGHRSPGRDGRARQHPRARHLRQRRVVRGRPDRLAQRRPRVERVAAARSRRRSARIDDIGGPRLHNNYPWGWTVAGNTPFRRWKREIHEGGVADPLSCTGRRGIAARGGVRTQYVHAIDLLPTVLELAGVDAPAVVDGVEQTPLDGRELRARASTPPDAPERHTVQYFEMFGCRALYQDGWKAVVVPPTSSSTSPGLDRRATGSCTTCGPTRPNATTSPPRSPSASRRWSTAGGRKQKRNDVLPLDNRPFSEFVLERRSSVAPRHRYVYWPGRRAGARERRGQHPQPAAHRHRGRAPRRHAGSKACSCPKAPCSEAGRSTSSTDACASSTTSRDGALTAWTCRSRRRSNRA